MEKTYRFRVNVCKDEWRYYLNVRPFKLSPRTKRDTDSLTLSELNAPLFINRPAVGKEGAEPEYFLDFEKSFDEYHRLYGDSYFKRDPRKTIARRLEEEADYLIQQAVHQPMSGARLLEKEAVIKFKLDSGLPRARRGASSRGRYSPISRKSTFLPRKKFKSPTE